MASTSAEISAPRRYVSKAGIDDGLPENPYLATVTSEAFPQVGGKILVYHPNKDFTFKTPGIVVLYNDFGYLFELDLDDQDRAYVGKRRIDIEAYNKLTPAERNRRRDDPLQSELLIVPPATPEELVAAEYFYQPASPNTDSESHKEESQSDNEDLVALAIRHSPIEPTMTTQTHSRLATHIARGNVTLPNVPPIFIPAPQRPPTPPPPVHPLQELQVEEEEEEEEVEAEVEEEEEEAEAEADKQIPTHRPTSDSAETLLKYSQEKEKRQTVSSPNSNATIWPISESQSLIPGSERSSSPAPTSKVPLSINGSTEQ